MNTGIAMANGCMGSIYRGLLFVVLLRGGYGREGVACQCEMRADKPSAHGLLATCRRPEGFYYGLECGQEAGDAFGQLIRFFKLSGMGRVDGFKGVWAIVTELVAYKFGDLSDVDNSVVVSQDSQRGAGVGHDGNPGQFLDFIHNIGRLQSDFRCFQWVVINKIEPSFLQGEICGLHGDGDAGMASLRLEVEFRDHFHHDIFSNGNHRTEPFIPEETRGQKDQAVWFYAEFGCGNGCVLRSLAPASQVNAGKGSLQKIHMTGDIIDHLGDCP